MTRLTFDELLYGEVQVCIINEPINDEPIEPLTSIAIAQRRWRYAELINGDKHERRLQ